MSNVPSSFFSSVLSGVIVGIMGVVFLSSYASLIFAGDLGQYLSDGIVVALISGVIMAVVVALMSSYPGSVAFPQDIGAAIFGLIAVEISGVAATETAFPTIVALLMISSLAMGVVCLAMGYFRLGRLIRFIPFPVIAGFMAAIGWLLLGGAISLMTGVTLGVGTFPALVTAPSLSNLLPGLAFGVVAIVVVRRIRHALTFPALMIGALVIFYVAVAVTGIGLSEASDRGWLLGPFPEDGPGLSIVASQIVDADWKIVIAQLPTVGTILIVSIIGLLLNASAIELTVRRDIDINRELRTAGLANILATPGGGMVGFHYLSLSALSHRMGGRTQIVGLVTAGIFALALIIGTSALSNLPKFVLGGLIAYLGFEFLLEWLVASRKRISRFEYLIVVLIFAVSISAGYLEGIGVGILASAVLFIFEYSRIRVVKHALSGAALHSNVDRRDHISDRLGVIGDQIYILKLQGFIFFGTATRLIGRVRTRLSGDRATLKFLLLDFRQVSGIDSSAVLSFKKLQQMSEKEGFSIVFACLSPGLVAKLRANDLMETDQGGIRLIDDFDQALEWCENQILDADGTDRHGRAETLIEYMAGKLPAHLDVAKLEYFLERLPIEKGRYLMRQADDSGSLYFVESGKLAVTIEGEGGAQMRIRSVNHGTVGEVGMYVGVPRTASISAEEDSTVYRLVREDLERMEREEPELASAFHKFIARRLAQRLADTTEVLREVLD